MLSTLLAGSAILGKKISWEGQILYHIFVRSYRDSNQDGIGDFKGIEQGLPTIKALGATAILLSPVQKSRVYHNYFADDFLEPDPKFGSIESFQHLVVAAHRLGIRVLLDMEPQYVADKHRWYRRAMDGEKGLVWNAVPDHPADPSFWYDGARVRISQVYLNNPEIRRSIIDTFRFWRKVGVDGFRIDHMMDDLDGAGKSKDLYRTLWDPLEVELKRDFPGTYFLAEQADWGSSQAIQDIFTSTHTDAVFDFHLMGAIQSFRKNDIERELSTPKLGDMVTFLENHDLPRFASSVPDRARQKLAAALLMTAKGIPSIYYGEELGMLGRKGDWHSDGNDIPLRLGYRWGQRLNDPRTPLWYRDTGPWWSTLYSRSYDGRSLPEQRSDPTSLLHWFQKLARIRTRSKALSLGTQSVLKSDSDRLLAFQRIHGRESVTVLANLSDEPLSIAPVVDEPRVDLLSGREIDRHHRENLAPWSVLILARK